MSSFPPPAGAPPTTAVPRIVADLAHRFSDITGVVVFTRDGLLRVFVPPLSFQDAERWAALLNQLAALARRAGTVLGRGAVESTLVRADAQQCALIQPVTAASDIGVLVADGTHLAQIAHATAHTAAQLSSLLPSEVSRRIGAPVQAAVA